MMKRILHVVTAMNRGGLESRLMDIYRYIDREKVQFDFYTNRKEKGAFEEEIKHLGGAIFHNKPFHPLEIKKKEKEFFDFLCRHPEYDIVHIHLNELSGVYCKAAKRAGVTVRIVHSRGASQNRRIKNVYKNMLKKSIASTATHLFAVSQLAGEHLYGSKAMNERGEVWPNAIDSKSFKFDKIKRDELRTEFNFNNNFVVMHVGNFTAAKNHPLIINVFSEVIQLVPEAQLVLVGGGENKDNICELVVDKGLSDSVSFLGSRNNINELLQMADIFLFPSLHEGFPGAVLEAQAAGLPCVISSSITKEVVLLDNCIQLDLTDSIEHWAKQIVKFKGAIRHDTYEYICDRGYDIKNVASNYEQFYLSAIAKN